MRALVVQEGQTVAVKDVSVPELDDNDILVKVVAAAQNPTDWKHVQNFCKPGAILGCEFSGTVVKLGNATTAPVNVGDHVAGFVQGGHWTDRGAYAEYVKTDSDLVWVVPKGTVSHEEAATISCGVWTVVQAFYHPTRLGLVAPPDVSSSGSWIFIYGGSTSVGQYAIQLAHLSGYKVATVASPRNHALVKQLGADVVFDYNSPGVVEQIKSATQNSVHLGLDTISVDGSQAFSVGTFGPGPGKLITLLPSDPEAKRLRADVDIQFTLMYTVLGRPFTFGTAEKTYPAIPHDRAHMADFLPTLSAIVQAGGIKPNRVKLWDGGLDAVKDGLAYMMAGKVSGEKIVYRV